MRQQSVRIQSRDVLAADLAKESQRLIPLITIIGHMHDRIR